jgi:hypothetical protein
MNDNTLITSKKYKTLGKLLKAPIKSILLVSNHSGYDPMINTLPVFRYP